MNRREVGLSLLGGAVAMGASTAALAQATREPMGAAEREHATDTLKIGGLALRSSQLAQTKASGAKVKEFAGFEVAEQTTIAQILRESSGMNPPPPDAEERAATARLTAANGSAFDAAYVAAQIDGHQKLLAVQERYLSAGRQPHMRHVAMLARGQIKEHLQLLEDMRGNA
jgi:putative membrane protein